MSSNSPCRSFVETRWRPRISVPPSATPERFEALKEKGCLATEYLFDAANPRTWYFHRAPQMPRIHQPGGEDAEAVAPTFLLGCGNWIFSANALMNPWVHLETHHRSIAPIRQGETVRCEMLVEEWFERREHLFADVTVSLFEAQSKGWLERSSISAPFIDSVVQTRLLKSRPLV